jgi:hypothetical protein
MRLLALLVALLLTACSDNPAQPPIPHFDGPSSLELTSYASTCAVELLQPAGQGGLYGCFPEPHRRAVWYCPGGKTPWFFYDWDGRLNGYLCFKL